LIPLKSGILQLAAGYKPKLTNNNKKMLYLFIGVIFIAVVAVLIIQSKLS